MAERDFHQLASSFYLCETLPDGWCCWDEETYNTFLEDNAYEPFEHHDAEDINEHIEDLAHTFKHVAKEARDGS